MQNSIQTADAMLYRRTSEFLRRARCVDSAVLFGSAASLKSGGAAAPAFVSNDYDFHLVVRRPQLFEALDWASEFRPNGYCFHSCRQATGGVRKLTVICTGGHLDMVIVPLWSMRFASLAIRFGCFQNLEFFRRAFNEMATCLHSGYEFIKGGEKWGGFYTKIHSLPGVRLSRDDVFELADVFLVDVLWVFQKIRSGEIVAASHVLHCRLIDTNLRLWREMRLRKCQPLPSFGLGRRVEVVASFDERKRFALNSCADFDDIKSHADAILRGTTTLLGELEPRWRIPVDMRRLLDSYQT